MRYHVVLIITLLTTVFCVPSQAYKGDKIRGDSLRGMDRGSVFFMPENEAYYIDGLLNSDLVSGAEIYTTWGAVEKSEGVYDWSYIDKMISRFKSAGKTVALRIATTNFSINDSPEYLYNKYGLRRVVSGYWENFESSDKGYIILGEITDTDPISGRKSISMSSSKRKAMIETGDQQRFIRDGGIVNPTHNKPTVNWVKRRSNSFCLQFDYRADSKTTFYAKAYSRSKPKLAEYKQWTVERGEKGMKTFQFYPKSDDYKVETGVVRGDLTIDNIMICDMVTAYHSGTLCFPNFFDPVFKEKYEAFVKAFAEKYCDEQALNSICIGGYGRWEEITLSDELPGIFEDQWTTFGFTNEAYIDHIKWCIDTYKKYFTTKNLYTGAVGWSNDWFRDQVYIDWKVATYAASRGVGIKYNGWQHLCSEWGSPAVGFFYAINRYRHDKSVWAMFEEGGQVDGQEFMGHPLSLFNKAILENIDYYWIYPNDLSQPLFQRYQHYANEMAGTALITKLYNRFGSYEYYSPKVRKLLNQRNIWMGLFQKDNVLESTLFSFVDIGGAKAVQTNDNQRAINVSIDDRVRYNTMYGAMLMIDYLDLGEDSLRVLAKAADGFEQVAAVAKSNSGAWKTLHLQDNGWGTRSANSGMDDLVEIIVDDMNDGVETLSAMEINYVPAQDWEQLVVQSNELGADNKTLLTDVHTFDVAPVRGEAVSSIAINVSIAQKGNVNINACVAALVDGIYVPVVTKDYFLPQGRDWFNIPMANVPVADSYRVSVKCTEGGAYMNLGLNNNPAYRLYRFVYKSDEAIQPSTDVEALHSFCALKTDGVALQGKLNVVRLLSNGMAMKMTEAVIGPHGVAYFEPQVAGHYRIENSVGQLVTATPIYLSRLADVKLPDRNLRGNPKMTLDNLCVGDGFKHYYNDDMGFHATLKSCNSYVLTNEDLALESAPEDQFRLVIKNQTGSSLCKLYWRDSSSTFSETNSVLIPIVPNDEYYREYTFPVGMESGWRGTMSQLKFVPIFGHTDAGEVHINSMELRNGTNILSEFGQKFNVERTAFNAQPVINKKINKR